MILWSLRESGLNSKSAMAAFCRDDNFQRMLCFQSVFFFKGKESFNSCIVINIYPLYIPSIKKATEYRNN